MKKTTTAEFLGYCDRKYPGLIDNEPFRRMFMYLAFGTYLDVHHQGGELILSWTKLVHLYGGRKAARWREFRALPFLRSFRSKVMPGFTWNAAQAPDLNTWEFGRCRTVKTTGLDAETLEMVRRELQAPPGDRYYFDSGKKFSRALQAEVRKTDLEEYQEDRKLFALNPTQEKILAALEPAALLGKAYTLKLTENRERVLEAIEALETSPGDKITLEEKKDLQRKVIASIEDDARIFYRPTPLGRTPRLHASNECVVTLKSPVRKAFCHGWTEVDLVSSQFVILAAILNAPESKEFVRSGQHLWTHLHEFCGGKGKPNRSEKDVYKEVIYGICFGKSAANSPESIEAIATRHQKPQLLENPIVAECLERREAWFQSIKKHGQVTDVWGRIHRLEKAGRKPDIYGNLVYAKERWEGSLAATKIQSIEMEIISAVFDVFASNPQDEAHPMLFQHDGLTISFNRKDKKEIALAKLQEAIRVKAEAVGKPMNLDLSGMRLEFEDL